MPLPPPNDTQFIDERSGLVFPWFTKPFLDVLVTWDLKDKRVFEYGGGHGTLWWINNVRSVDTVECNMDWYADIFVEICNKGWLAKPGGLFPRKVVDGEVELKSKYVNAIYECEGEFDLIVVDGSYRDECVAAALTKIKDGGIIICDNWKQDYVWDSIMASRLLDPWPGNVFEQPDHTNHEGRPWKTGFWQIYKDEQRQINGERFSKSLFSVTNAYNSHRPMLWMALEHIKPGLVAEMGCGYGSTPLLSRYSALQARAFASWDTNKEWADKFPYLTNWIPINYNNLLTQQSIIASSICFIDCSPAEERFKLLHEHADRFTVLIVHDTEPESDYVYHLHGTLNDFKYRCDLIIDGYPQTTAVSNVYDFERWKGVTLGKFKFV